MRAVTLRGVRPLGASATDLHIVDGMIVDEAPTGARVVDADGLIALPGLVDLHTHLRQPGDEGAETIATGTRAAAKGGYTAVFAMPNTEPPVDNVRTLDRVLELAKTAHAQVVPVAAITRGRFGERLSNLEALGASGVRVFSDDGSCLMNAKLMREALQVTREFDGVIAQHSQDHRIAGPTACCHESDVSRATGLEAWPEVAEASIVARDSALAYDTGGRLHVCHVSSADTLDVIRWAKQRGIAVSCEVTPHHLLLDTELLRDPATRDTVYKVNPPLTCSENRQALIEGLADGTIDIVATDHAPHTLESKSRPFELAKPGMIGLEQALAVVIEVMVKPGLFDWKDVARVMSAVPASIGRLKGQGLPISPGRPANLVLIDADRRAIVDRKTSASKGINNPYTGLDLPDPIEATIWQGEVTYQRR